MVYHNMTIVINDNEGQPEEQNLGHEEAVVGTHIFGGHFQQTPLHLYYEMLSQIWKGECKTCKTEYK